MALPVNMNQNYPQPRPNVDVVSAILTSVENAARPLENHRLPDAWITDSLKDYFLPAAKDWEEVMARRLARDLNKTRWDVSFLRGVMPEIRKHAKGQAGDALREADEQLHAIERFCGDDFAGFFNVLPQPMRARLANFSRLFDKDVNDDRIGLGREIGYNPSLIAPFARAVTNDIVTMAGHHAVYAANMVRENVTLYHIVEQGEEVSPADMADFNSNLKDIRMHVASAHKWLSTSLRSATRIEAHCLSIPAPQPRPKP